MADLAALPPPSSFWAAPESSSTAVSPPAASAAAAPPAAKPAAPTPAAPAAPAAPAEPAAEPAAAAPANTKAEEAVDALAQGISTSSLGDPKATRLQEAPPPTTYDPTRYEGLFDETPIQVLQDDPNSPLHSVKSFEELSLRPELLKGIYAMGFNKPSRIQETALPLILQEPRKNLIGQSQSGTGKTAAFVLGMLSHVDENRRTTQALCVAPTRELARQIASNVEMMGKFIPGLRVHLSVPNEVKTVPRGQVIAAHVIVGTPGTVQSQIRSRQLQTQDIHVYVTDEADVMFDKQGMADQTTRIKKLLPPNVQSLLFSATFKEAVKAFALKVVPNPNIIQLKVQELSLDVIKQFWIKCMNEGAKHEMLDELYGTLEMGQSIVFVNTRRGAQEVAQLMRDAGHTVSVLHGADMEVAERDRVIDAFREGSTKVLITTNVLARGVDVPAVSLVINYDMPVEKDGVPDPETYLHRIGRGGRFGRRSVSVNLIGSNEEYQVQAAIARKVDRAITEIPSTELELLEQAIKARASKQS